MVKEFRVAELYEFGLQPEHIASVNPHVYPTTITDTGALSVSSGLKTGRTPKEKRVVLDATTKDVRPHFNCTMILMMAVDYLVGQSQYSHLT